jgi:hypothetical protein
MPQLFWVPDNHRAFSAIQQRKSRSDITLTGLIDYKEIEETWVKRYPSSGTQRWHSPARKHSCDMREHLVVASENFGAQAPVVLVRRDDHSEQSAVVAKLLPLLGTQSVRLETKPNAPESFRVLAKTLSELAALTA